MMKKFTIVVITILLMVIFVTPQTFALSKAKALKTAKKNVPSGAKLKDYDKLGTFHEFEFINKSKTKEYTVLINVKNKLQQKIVETKDARGGASIAISTTKANSIAKKAFTGISIYHTVLRKHNGWVYTVSFKKKSSFIGVVEINAKSGAIIEWKKLYKRKGLMSPFTARQTLLKKVVGARLLDMELDYSSGKKRWEYEIEAIKGEHIYELKLNGSNGKILEFDDD